MVSSQRVTLVLDHFACKMIPYRQLSYCFVILLDKHAPFRQRKGRNIYALWINPELTGKRRTRDILKQKAVKMKSEILTQAYKEM